MALNSKGKRMSEKIKMVIVQYLFMHLSVEAIRSKQEHSQLYDFAIWTGKLNAS